MFGACQPPPRGPEMQSRSGVSPKRPWFPAGGGAFRPRPVVPEHLAPTDATVHALVEVVERLPHEEQEALLAPYWAFGPAPSVGGPWAPTALLELAPWEADTVDVAGVLGAYETALGARELALAAFFVGPEPIARVRARRSLRRLAPEKLTLARLRPHLRRSERARLALAEETLSRAALLSLQWPVERTFRVTSKFGPRVHPVSGRARAHRGIDLGVPEGTVIRAPADGVVRVVAHGKMNGKWVEVDHGGGVRTQYVHLSAISVKRRQQVTAGDVLGLSGATGRVTGPHLHFQVKHLGEAVDPLLHRVSPASARRLVPRPTPSQIPGTQTAMP